ncbi:ribosome small subunit-dependent GTPase A [Gracilibacillus dipsosauri]|uniref:Small ribosomal subunit biogenesis GTPase RsgA n=1 Tax=Gracilibacillus dipsosauri TaxID=178340 RepID=A0A317KZD7_9BACI|nr:ribosome small subunit-dependent GTPase A [Gracilibacillus dipsosauri]PWU68912.1 ribosome small subunit-dependent GTPase A [Gracilibacillus dipsosauri]
MAKGRIIKALSGFYYVDYNGKVFRCRGRGVFRKRKITPLVGDSVEFEESGEQEGYITAIDDRKNELVRPPIANVDQAIVLSSAKEPNLSLNLLDKFLVMVESKHIQPILFFTKMDLLEKSEAQSLQSKLQYYQDIGYTIRFLSKEDQDLVEQVSSFLEQRISVFAGQSGVGKTSLLNALIPGLELETNEISESLGRGKHTTRHVELIPFQNGLIADTPGFSALDFAELELESLPNCFPEFVERRDTCKFRGCMHIKEPGCAVKTAVEHKEILAERYENYLHFIEEIKQRKPRY